MSFAVSKLLWAVASPGNLLVLAQTLGTFLLFLRKTRRVGMGLVLLTTLTMLGVATTAVSSWVALPLEESFPRPTLPEQVDGIIMLGGAVNPPITRERGDPSVNEAAERILSFAELSRRYPDAKLLFTGGSGVLFGQDYKEDVAARAALRQAGVDTDRVLFESESRNTWENAVYSKKLVAPAPGETWILVTSAMHMPRSVGIFRRIGWQVLPYPVDYRTRPHGLPRLRFEFVKGIDLLTDGVREWLGLVSYHLMDRTTELLPKP
jgi:uncharacterized SAM-binding protein YcdF (DUF218 family)